MITTWVLRQKILLRNLKFLAKEQDAFAVASQQKADDAIKAGTFADEIVSIEIPQRKGDPIIFEQDEFPRLSPLEKVAAMRPAFKKDGTVTAANASGINDGAAAVIVMSAEEAKQRGLKPLAKIASYAVSGVNPEIMGTGPIPASQAALEKAGWKHEDLDLIEAKRSFCCPSCLCEQRNGLGYR